MAEVHKLLTEHGKAEVLKMEVDRRVVEAAASYMGAEETEVGFLYSGWAQSGLPHKRLADDASWQVRTDHVSLLVQPGQRHTLTGEPISIGVPYGSRARLICLYLQSEALKNLLSVQNYQRCFLNSSNAIPCQSKKQQLSPFQTTVWQLTYIAGLPTDCMLSRYLHP
jgi:hypothetical protein